MGSKPSILPLSAPRPSVSSKSLPHSEPSETDIQNQPWKYLGYRAFCEWSASDNDLFVLRRFGALNTRVILKMQDDIVQLEDELAEIDKENAQVHVPPVNNGSFRNDSIQRRQGILQEAGEKLKKYNSYIAKYSEIRARPTADSHERTNVENWLFYRHQGAIFPAETQYVTRADDLIRLVHELKTPLRKIIEKSRLVIVCKWLKLHFQATPLGSDPESTYYYDDQLIETIIKYAIVFLGLVMLIAPLWWLLFVDAPAYRLGIITGFMTLFLVLVASLTGARPFETLAATAAYSAVLMVYMQSAGTAS